MTTIQNNPVSSNLLDAMNGTTSGKNATQEAQDRFMTLLVTQMRNQDPLNPMDNAQMTSQLAQLSTVTGIEKLNDTMQALIGNVQSSQTFQAAAMIGRTVLVPGNGTQLTDGEAKYGVALPVNVDKLDITIRDKSGNVVRTVSLGAQKAGLLPFTWDGHNNDGDSMANGLYKVEASATVAGKKVEIGTLSQGQVSSIANSSQGVMLTVKDLGTVGLNEILQVL